MPIEAPSGTLDIENAKLRVSEISATTSVGIGTENEQKYPIYIYKATEPELLIQEGASAAAKFTSKNGCLVIQSGVDPSNSSAGDIGFSTMGDTTRHVTILGTNGNVGIGVTNPSYKLHVNGTLTATSGNFSGSVGIGTASPSGKLHVYDVTAVAGWQNFYVRPTSLWGDGLSVPSETGGTLYMTMNNMMFQRPHITPYAAGGNAYIRYGRAGGISTGVYWETACVTDGSFRIRRDANDAYGMTITSDGDVGMGTVSPSSALHVNLGNAAGEQHIRATQTSLANSTAGIRFGDSTWDAFIDHSHGSKDLMNFGFYRNPTRQVNMVLTHEGNVGIGTADPTAPLHVMGAIKTQNNGVWTPQIQFSSGTNNTNGWLVRANISDTYAGAFTIDRQDNSTTPNKFVITNSGNVGIGTASPGYGLHVYGYAGGIDLGPVAAMGFEDDGVSFCGIKVGQKVSNPFARTALSVEDNGTTILHVDGWNRRVGIGTASPAYPLSFTRAGFDVKSAVVNPMSTLGIGAFNFGELFVGDNVVTECICVYNPTAEGNYTVKCGYVQWIQIKVRGTGIDGIQIIKSYSADSSTVTVTAGGSNTHSSVLTVSSGTANISYTARVFYRALDTP